MSSPHQPIPDPLKAALAAYLHRCDVCEVFVTLLALGGTLVGIVAAWLTLVYKIVLALHGCRYTALSPSARRGSA